MSRMNHIEQALGHLDAVATTRDHLKDLYEQQRRGGLHAENLGAKVAEAHQSIGYGLKVAHIHAALAQAAAVERLAKAELRGAVTL